MKHSFIPGPPWDQALIYSGLEGEGGGEGGEGGEGEGEGFGAFGPVSRSYAKPKNPWATFVSPKP